MKSLGFIIGITIGIILIVILYRFANTNHKTMTQYDERQKEIRGKAYQYAFYTMVIFEVIMLILEVGEIPLPVDGYILHFAGILIGSLVLACYCIWKDVYWGLNNNRKRYALIFLATAALNAIPLIGALTHGGLKEGGRFAPPVLNLLVLIMLAILGGELLVKHFVEKKEAAE